MRKEAAAAAAMREQPPPREGDREHRGLVLGGGVITENIYLKMQQAARTPSVSPESPQTGSSAAPNQLAVYTTN
jgi:hypothetical protein